MAVGLYNHGTRGSEVISVRTLLRVIWKNLLSEVTKET